MFFFKVIPLFLILLSWVKTCKATNGSIHWFPCTQNGTRPFTCGTLTVPLDYTNTASNDTLDLQLVKVSAVKQPNKGSILVNPGGPGGSGRDLVVGDQAPALLVATGGVYDLIGFAPRGTSNTIPFSCFTDDVARLTLLQRSGLLLNASDTAIGEAWALRTVFASSCYQNGRNVGELIGTGFVARDMMRIVDALHEDGLLRYWGFSYGTIIGMTVAAMFPTRMDKIVLDGVINPHDYYAGIDLEQFTDSDATFDGFFEGCIAHPEACEFAQHASTPKELKTKFYDLLYTLKYQPLVLGATIYDYSAFKTAAVNAMYSPSTWPFLATGLHGLFTQNATAALALTPLLTQVPDGIFPNPYLLEASIGIRSSDVALRTNNLTSLYPLIRQFFAKSQLYGDSIVASLFLAYAQWPFKAKGAYRGDFRHVKTKKPVLFVGSERDPVTPLASARNASEGFVGSRVLVHTGYGHTSPSQPSLCVVKAIRAYFLNGTLPAGGTRCEPSVGLFENVTLEDVLAPLANLTKRGGGLDGDRALLSATAQLRPRGLRRS